MRALFLLGAHASTAHADEASISTTAERDEPANLITGDFVTGALGFTGHNVGGEWSIGYERRLGVNHALVLEQTWVHVHHHPFHLTVAGIAAGYRYYLRPGTSPFAGVLVGGKVGFGRFGEGMDNDLSARALAATAHVGYRWVRGRLALTARIGAGVRDYRLGGSAKDLAEDMSDRLEPLPIEIDSELGIGVRF
jgi:hypothetical protein